MTRKIMMEKLKETLLSLDCAVETRRDFERVPVSPADTPRLIINDGAAAQEEESKPTGGNGGFRRWTLKVGIIAVARDEDTAAAILSIVAKKLAELEEAKPDEITGIELESHDFAIVQDEYRVAAASMQLNVGYLAGRWEV